jgi:hypothetical protein
MVLADNRFAVPAGTSGQPRLEVLDVRPSDSRHLGDGGVVADQELGEQTQGSVGDVHAARTQRDRQLVQIAAHGSRQPRRGHDEVVPHGLRAWRPTAGLAQSGDWLGGHVQPLRASVSR